MVESWSAAINLLLCLLPPPALRESWRGILELEERQRPPLSADFNRL